MTRIGFGTAYAPGQGDYDPRGHSFENNPVTHDPKRWAVHHQWFRFHPELRVGGVTWAWLNATFRSVDLLARTETVAGVDLPILLLSPQQDPLIPPDSHRNFCLRYHNCTVIRYPEARHEVLMETDDLRDRAWADIDHSSSRSSVPPPRPRPPKPRRSSTEKIIHEAGYSATPPWAPDQSTGLFRNFSTSPSVCVSK